MATVTMTSFHSYDPQTRAQQSQPKACEACYVRKVRCGFEEGSDSCKNCQSHGMDCKPRTRKRKSTSTGNHAPKQLQTSGNDSGRANGQGSPASKRRRTSGGDHEEASPQQDARRNTDPNLQSNDLSAPLLFIGHQNALASSPGTTANPPTSSVDEFHNSSYLSRSAILGDDFPDIDHSHADQTREHKLSATELQVLHLYHAFDLPELPLRQSLIEAFKERCWTWMPVVDALSLSAGSPDSDSSLLLLQAVLLVGALMRPEIVPKADVDAYYQRVKALVNSGYERNPLNILASLCLIQWYTPTAPKDVSTDTPRFWESCALGIAQQIGLHRQPKRRKRDYGLRRRLWWTLYIRDSLMASAHGRPRMLSLADCSMEPPTVNDFDQPADIASQIFVSYYGITSIMYDLCHLLIQQRPPSSNQKDPISQRLLDFTRTLPLSLRLHDSDGQQQPYDFNIAQLHVPLLATITILYRPRSIFELSPSNAASIAAANLLFRIVQAIQYREQTRYLSSAFAWHLLVAAIPHLSCLLVPSLHVEANAALDALENVLETLGTVRPSAANNLRNVRAIRKAVISKEASTRTTKAVPQVAGPNDAASNISPGEILGLYGTEAVQNLESITTALSTSAEMPVPVMRQFDNATNFSGISSGTPQFDEQQFAGDGGVNSTGSMPTQNLEDFGGDFSSIFTNHFQENTWMRNWIDELQLFPE